MTEQTAPTGVVTVQLTTGDDLPTLSDRVRAALRSTDGAAVMVEVSRTALDPTGDEDAEDRAARAAAALHRALERAGLPSVIAVAGPVSGAGLAALLSFDVAVCHPRTTVTAGTPAAVLACGLPALLTRQVGPGRARALALTGQRLGAVTAQGWGLIAEVSEEYASRAAALAAGWAASRGAGLVSRALTAAERLPADESAAFDRDLRALLAEPTDPGTT